MLKRYKQDGFFISERPILAENVIIDVLGGVEAMMSGIYDTGVEPPKSRWKPGDDPKILRKINMPQISCLAFRRLLGYEGLGQFAHSVTGAKNIQVSVDGNL